MDAPPSLGTMFTVILGFVLIALVLAIATHPDNRG